MPYEHTTALSPDGAWLATTIDELQVLGTQSFDIPSQPGGMRVIAENVQIMRRPRQWLVAARLDDDRPARTLHVAEGGGELGWPAVLDDGTVLCADEKHRELFRWQADGSRRSSALLASPHQGILHVRPDGRELLVLHMPMLDDDIDDDELAWGASIVDLATGAIADWPRFPSHHVFGWIGPDELIAIEPVRLARLLRIDLRDRTCQPIADAGLLRRASASPAWIVWHADGFHRLGTGRNETPTALPGLDAWHPRLPIDDHCFLCSREDGSHAIIDVRHDLAIVGRPTLPPGPISYARAIDAFVTCRDGTCEIYGRDGVLQRSIPLVAG